ncbi:hypothetical protein TWF718_009399 [Orbilia javanica]
MEATDAGEAEEKPSSKRRVSRARKGSVNQRKKITPRNKPDQDGQQDPVSKSGDAENHAKESKKPVRGKKRGSAAMEEGGKKLLFPKEDDGPKAGDGEQLPEGLETQKPRPTKRRVTRASIVNQSSALDLATSAPSHIACGDDNDAEPTSPHNTPVKPKPKEKKKAIRPSTTASKPGKTTKKTTSKTPLNLPGPSDEEIGRELEREIMGGKGDTDNTNMKAGPLDPELGSFHDSNNLAESDAAEQPAKKTTRRLTRTKPVSRRSPSPVSAGPPDGQELTQPKPRRKGLTRTKTQTPSSTGVQSGLGDVIRLETTNNIETDVETTVKTLPTPQDMSEGAIPARGTRSNERSSLLDRPAQTPTPKHSEAAPPNSKTEPIPTPKVPEPVPPVESVPVEAIANSASTIEEGGCSTEDTKGSQEESPTQTVATTSTSISHTKDKDMKRKSDVVADDGKDRRTSKKRKTVKVVKAVTPRISPKKEVGALIPPESQKIQDNSKPKGQSVGSPRQKSAATTVSEESAPQAEVPVSHEDPALEEQDTILDDPGDNQDGGAEGEEDGSVIVQESMYDDNTVGVILDGYTRPRAVSPQKPVQEEAPSASGIGNSPYSPRLSSDIESQDSIPNTQFSAPASQMTVATSFQGSFRGVSFVRAAEEPAPAERGVSPIDDVREQSVVVSPKQSRTPLSVLSKSHNGALALMTPRNRAEDVTFAPVQSHKPWKSTDVDLYIDGLKENQEMELRGGGLSDSERDMTVAEWIMNVSKRAEKQLIQKGELLVRFFEEEAERAVAAIEAIETE